MLFAVIAAAVLALAGAPYVRILFKRLSLRRRMIRLCRDIGAELYPCRPLWWLIHRGDTCDFMAVDGGRAFAVRLIAARHRSDALVFGDGYYFSIRRLALASLWASAVLPVESRPRPMPGCDIPAGMREVTGRSPVIRCLLLNPVCADLFRETSHRERIPLGSGETAGGADILRLYDFSRFAAELCEQSS